jgi:hypothetical protein
MQASIKVKQNESVSLQLDVEAAHAVFASVLFASRFHEEITSLAKVAEKGLRNDAPLTARRTELCQ